MASLTLLLAATLVGLGIGIVLQKSRLCYASMLSDLFLFRTVSPNGQGLLLATGLTMLAWSVTFAVRGAEGFWLPAWGWFGIVGGAIFGVGMITAGGCMMSALYRAATGHVQYLLTLVFTGVGYLAYGLLYPVFLDNYFTPLWRGPGATAFELTPLPAPAVAVAVVAVSLLVYAWFVGRTERQLRRGRPVADGSGDPATAGPTTAGPLDAMRTGLRGIDAGTRRQLHRFRSVPSVRSVLTSSWDPRAGGVALAILAASWLWLHGVWTVSGPEAGWVALAVDAVGIDTPALAQWELALFGPGPSAVSANMAVMAGAGGGAVLAAVVSGEFGIRWPEPETVPYATGGGFLMGVGASLTPGCNIGNMYTGIAELSLHSAVATVGMILGAYVATRWLF